MKMKHSATVASFVTLVTSLLVTASFAGGPGYHVVKTYKLGGEGGWDYLTLDPVSRHLFISRATHVIVIDADSGKSIGDIPDTPGVHGIALDRKSTRLNSSHTVISYAVFCLKKKTRSVVHTRRQAT